MLSFFDDKPSSSATGPIISKVKKTVQRPTPPTRPSSTSTPGSKYKSASSSSYSKSSPSSSTLKVPSSSKHKIASSPLRSSPAPRKRKTAVQTKIESESESESESGSAKGTPRARRATSASSEDALDAKRRRKGSTANGLSVGSLTPRGSSKASEDVYGRWCLDLVDSRGEFGRGWVGFVGSEEVVKGSVSGWAGGNKQDGGMDKYVSYFPQQGFEKDALPSVELLYPAKGCKERFFLFAPTSAREYSPIGELRAALRAILNYYIPPSHQAIFGTLADSLDLDSMTPLNVSAVNSPAPGTPPVDIPGTPGTNSTPGPFFQSSETIGDALRKALAPNRRDGPAFVKAMERFNAAMEEIQNDGSLAKWMSSRPGLSRREWAGLVETVHEQAYSRVVGPYSNELEHHPKHPDEVAKVIMGKEDAYGELRHSFITRIIDQTGLNADSVFVDLGSGVGNCVMQAALEAGSASYGYELLPVPAHCARLQLCETQRRWAMWGLKGNTNVQVHEGDLRVHPTVAKRLREADVVLVNNEVFSPALNADLTNMFLDLKEGAKIVSLKPFVPETFKMNEANCDSFAAIVRLSQHTYYRDWVSWKGDSGGYYVQVIDRSRRIQFEEELAKGGRRRR